MSGSGRSGRRPGDPEVTRRAILAAAREAFAARGFERATIRTIASLAGVDPALVHHHFGSKQELFVAALELAINPAEMIIGLAEMPVERRGEEIVRIYLTMLGTPTISLVRAAATNEAAARMLREFLQEALLSNAASLIDLPDARLRLSLVGSHMIGVVFARTIVGIPEIRDLEFEELVAALGPTIQRYLTDPAAIGDSA